MAVASDEGFGGKTFLRQWDPCEEVYEMLMVQVFSGFSFNFCWRLSAKTFAPFFLVVCCDQDCFVSFSSICF